MKKMKKVVVKGVKAKTKTPTVKSRKGQRGGSVAGTARTCSTCHKPGHNARSHYPGGKLAR